jgi:hypothetical protein
MPVPPNITQTAGDNQHVENHHRYDCEWNQVLHTYLLSGFDNLVIFLAQPFVFCFAKIAALKSSYFLTRCTFSKSAHATTNAVLI